jgi:hypothetical protein
MPFQRYPAFQIGYQQDVPAVVRHGVVLFPGEALQLKRLDRALYLLALVARDNAPTIMRPKFLQTGFNASRVPSQFSNVLYDAAVFDKLDR